MIAILSSIGLLTAILVIYLSFYIKDEQGAQVIRILGASIFLFSFLVSPVLIKLVMMLAFLFAWPYLCTRISLSFHRQLNK